MIDRYLEILDAIKSAGSPLTASEIARRTGIPMASTHRLVNQLAQARVLQKNEHGQLSIGIRLWEITARSSAIQTLREAALPEMQRVMAETNMPILLSVLDGESVVNVETLTPEGQTPVNITEPGVRLPALASSPGIAILAFIDRDACANLLASATLTRFTPFTPMERSTLGRIIDDTRRSGQIVVNRWIGPESGGVAVPILDSSNMAIGAISATTGADRTATAAIAASLRSAARAIRDALRASPSPVTPYLAALKSQVKRATENP